MNNIEMYKQARDVAELEFIECLKKYGFTDIRQATVNDDIHHIDCFAKYNSIEFVFDVKDLSKNYLTSKRYNMSNHLVNDIKHRKNAYNKHFIACREYHNSAPTGKYIVFKTLDVVNVVKQYRRRDNNKSFYLFDVNECMKRFSYRIM